MTQMTMSLFAADQSAAERLEAIDQLHHATAIYTAHHVVDELLERLRWPSSDEQRLLDPSAGDGMVLSRALVKMLAVRIYTDEELLYAVEGYEIHHHACTQARARIAKVLVENGGRTALDAQRLAERMVHNKDFLSAGPMHQSHHIVIGNPPYLRWVNVPSLLRDDYAKCVPGYASADMLHSFLDRCSKVLHDGGEMAFVTADRWLFNAGASKLRASLGQRLGIAHLERLEAHSVFYHPKQRRVGTPPRVHPVAVHLRHGHGAQITSAAIYPGANTELYAGLPTLGDIATVRLAPWLGGNGIFLITAAEAAAAGLPADVLVPAVDTDDVVNGVLGVPKRFAILTDPDVQPCAAVMAHLARNMGRMSARGKKAQPWSPPERFNRMDLGQPSLLVPRIARSPVAVRVPQNVLPVNHNLSIVCGDAATLERVERALRTDIAAQWVSEHAARLEGGYFSLTTRLLRELPIVCE